MEDTNNQLNTDQSVPLSPTDDLAGGISQLMHECEHNGQEDYRKELEAMNSILRKSTLILTDEDEKIAESGNSRQSLKGKNSKASIRSRGSNLSSAQFSRGGSLSSSSMAVDRSRSRSSKGSVMTNGSAMDTDTEENEEGENDGYMDEDDVMSSGDEGDRNDDDKNSNNNNNDNDNDNDNNASQSSISSTSSMEQADGNSNVDMVEGEEEEEDYSSGSNRSLSSIDSATVGRTTGHGIPGETEAADAGVVDSTTADTGLVKTNSEGRRPKRTKREMMAPLDIVWEQGGQNVFVTGTFTGWTKMIRMIRSDNKPNVFHVRLRLPPGTHRFRFVVDNELRFSDFLPTATDHMGNFVNYVEVRPSDAIHTDEQNSELEMERVGDTSVEMAQIKKMSTRSRIALKIKHEPDNLSDGFTKFREEAPKRAPLQYSSRLPAIFTDPRLMEQYYIRLHRERGSRQNTHLLPPQLPSQLEYVVLNDYPCTPGDTQTAHGGALPTPNHVVLHHLITSNIKHNTLGIATVVRYRDKYMTQIYYTPIDRPSN